MRILLVEDDAELARVVAAGLREHGHQVAVAGTLAEGRNQGMQGRFDLCREFRQRGVGTPLLMLTARDGVDDRVAGLEVGADDYLTKPFAFRELVARIKALGRRRAAQVAERVSVADLDVDLATRRVRRGGRSIELTAKEFTLLEFFLQHCGQVVDRASITAYVWDDNHDPFTNVLEVLVRRLRRKIDDDFEPKLIHTLRGAGYRFGV
jgi:two-component system copper resistance phosphate regulon response regulator CusR